jgi:hypothetical protein
MSHGAALRAYPLAHATFPEPARSLILPDEANQCFACPALFAKIFISENQK